MQLRGFFMGIFIFAVLLSVTTLAQAQSARDLKAFRIAEKLWRVIDITKQYQPFQVYVTLESPDGERVALTFAGESAKTLVRSDVIELEPKTGIPADIPEDAMGRWLIPHLPKWGKPRWWSKRAKHEGQEIRKAWKLYRLQKSVREPEF
jgi:hypothetical protein